MSRQFILPLLLLGLVVACSPLKIISDIDQHANFEQYKTYKWSVTEDPMDKNYPQFDNALNRERWKNAIDVAMKNHGYILGDDEVDLEVDFHLQFEHNAVPYHHRDHYDEAGSQYSRMERTSLYQYDQGTVIIHFVDREQRKIVWQGISTKVLDVKLLEKAEENIQTAVDKIFDKFESQISSK